MKLIDKILEKGVKKNMLVKYKITSYDDFVNPTIKKVDSIEVDENMYFNDLIDTIVGNYNKDYLNKQIYVEDLVELTWLKYFDYDFIFKRMECDSFHYKWLNNKLSKIQKSFNLFDNQINIVIEGPGIGRNIDNIEGISFIIHSNELDRHASFPHVHAEYSGEEIFIYIKDAKLLDNKGFKNKKKTKVAIAYVEDHKEELLRMWNLITGDTINIDVAFNI